MTADFVTVYSLAGRERNNALRCTDHGMNKENSMVALQTSGFPGNLPGNHLELSKGVKWGRLILLLIMAHPKHVFCPEMVTERPRLLFQFPERTFDPEPVTVQPDDGYRLQRQAGTGIVLQATEYLILAAVSTSFRSVLNARHWRAAPPDVHASMTAWLIARGNGAWSHSSPAGARGHGLRK